MSDFLLPSLVCIHLAHRLTQHTALRLEKRRSKEEQREMARSSRPSNYSSHVYDSVKGSDAQEGIEPPPSREEGQSASRKMCQMIRLLSG